MIVRPFEPGCEEASWDVFHSSVHRLTTRDDTAAERIAWAPHERDAALEARWVERRRRIRPRRPVGFAACIRPASPARR